jgi:hypothetical protein
MHEDIELSHDFILQLRSLSQAYALESSRAVRDGLRVRADSSRTFGTVARQLEKQWVRWNRCVVRPFVQR